MAASFTRWLLCLYLLFTLVSSDVCLFVLLSLYIVGEGSEPSLGRCMESFVASHGHIWYICAVRSYTREYTEDLTDSNGLGRLGHLNENLRASTMATPNGGQ